MRRDPIAELKTVNNAIKRQFPNLKGTTLEIQDQYNLDELWSRVIFNGIEKKETVKALIPEVFSMPFGRIETIIVQLVVGHVERFVNKLLRQTDNAINHRIGCAELLSEIAENLPETYKRGVELAKEISTVSDARIDEALDLHDLPIPGRNMDMFFENKRLALKAKEELTKEETQLEIEMF